MTNLTDVNVLLFQVTETPSASQPTTAKQPEETTTDATTSKPQSTTTTTAATTTATTPAGTNPANPTEVCTVQKSHHTYYPNQSMGACVSLVS
jgi:hypothetical protein